MTKMHTVWNAYGADTRLATRLWERKDHAFTADMQDAAFDWLDEQVR